ncbi:MAG: drug/metabolite transporter (DMT)-like permease [Candidatus Deianiraeaceae bacterium]|jgi:drug/metabolite transporter (DMT)-like permease
MIHWLSTNFSRKAVNIVLFTILTLTWGLVWFIAKFLVADTTLTLEILAGYRFLLAGLILFVVARASGLRMRPSKYELKVFCIVAMFGCSINLFLFYYSSFYLVSGFMSVVFSLIIILNLVIGSFFGVNQVSFFKILFLGFLGVAGLCCIIISHSGLENFLTMNMFKGIALGFVATLSFSISSTYYQTRKNIHLHAITCFTYMCIFGFVWCVIMAYVHAFLGKIGLLEMKSVVFTTEITLPFIISFLYLAIFGTAIGYLCSFTLVRRIGSVKTAYSSLLVPLISIGISYVWEGYHFTVLAMIGIACILFSEFLALRDKKIK